MRSATWFQHPLANCSFGDAFPFCVIGACCCWSCAIAVPVSLWMPGVGAELEKACAGKWTVFEDFCRPNHTAIVNELFKFREYSSSHKFLEDLHTVLTEQYFRWIPAWEGFAILLDASRPWTRQYCERYMESEPWSPLKLLFLSNVFPAIMQRMSLEGMRTQDPAFLEWLEGWLSDLAKSKDAVLRHLVDDWRYNHSQGDLVSRRPISRVVQHLHAGIVRHILKICKAEYSMIKSRFEETGYTFLHIASVFGNTPLVKVLLKAHPKKQRAHYAVASDLGGYTAEDLAHLGHYSDTAAVIRSFAGKFSQSSYSGKKGFPPIAASEGGNATCSRDEAAIGACAIFSQASHATRAGGGWGKYPSGQVVPRDWLPPADQPCFADVIDVAHFNMEVFEEHYVHHGQPLLIRGGAAMPSDVVERYTRKGLLKAAGSRKIVSQVTPYASEEGVEGHVAQSQSIRKYVSYLDKRAASSSWEDLSYVFILVPENDTALGFTHTLPKLVQARMELERQTQFYLGGARMGSMLHYHRHALNSLIHGRKLWFVRPPAEAVWGHMAMYQYIALTDGDPGSARCVQEAGDLFYLPHEWSHGTVCLDYCIGVAHELIQK